jgi:hypothetical protein
MDTELHHYLSAPRNSMKEGLARVARRMFSFFNNLNHDVLLTFLFSRFREDMIRAMRSMANTRF